MSEKHLTADPDPTTTAALAARGLSSRVVSTAQGEGFDEWLDVVRRGFLGTAATPEEFDAARERLDYRRKVGVYDATAPLPEAPVATIASWMTELTVPGGRGIPACAISSVTVSPTHRRRGVARAMVEGELRVAAALGAPMAMLTVSESTLYGRYGFGSAAVSVALDIDTKRASWTGPIPDGRVDFIPRERLRELGPALHDRVRPTFPGEHPIPAAMWDSLVRTRPDAKDPGALRAVQYTDVDGVVRGLASYTVAENDDDFTKATVTIVQLLAETPDAYAGLWRFILELDLVGKVEAHELALDEPVLWMISDQRAATLTVRDHQYLRVLDVVAALEARSYGAPGVLALDVSDPLGISGGRFVLTVGDDLRGSVRETDDLPVGAVDVALGTTELSAAYLGGVSLAMLAYAGRVATTDAAAAARIFGWHVTPRLTFWY